MKIFPYNYPVYDDSSSERGWSLIEVMVVLAILGLVVSVASASLRPQIEGMRFRSTSSDILNAIASYRVAAVTQRRRLVFQAMDGGDTGIVVGSPPFDMELPPGWSVVGGPLIFLRSGACLGGEIQISNPNGRTAQYSFLPPDCRPVAASR